jgi:glyoxylase-like metal-dependent hydrolase (beta-lactamase superfamily II)
LIDGGKQENTPLTKIKNEIQKINDSYDYADGQFFESPDDPKKIKSLRFDAVVVTHWDDDHFGGKLSHII